MHGEKHRVTRFVESEQNAAKDWAAREIKRAVRLLSRQKLRVRFLLVVRQAAQIDDCQYRARRWSNNLHRFTVDRYEAGAQNFMTPDDLRCRLIESDDVEGASEIDPGRHVVSKTLGL